MGELDGTALESLRSAIDGSRQETNGSIERLRTDLTGRIDQMVTQREYAADIRRIDSAHEAEVRRIDVEQAAIKKAHDDHLKDHEAERKAQKEERDRLDTERRADRRNFALVTITAVSVAVALAAWITSLFH